MRDAVSHCFTNVLFLCRIYLVCEFQHHGRNNKSEWITVQKMQLSIKNFFSKSDQIRSFLRIWSHLLKKSLMKNFIFCAVNKETFFCEKQENSSLENFVLPFPLQIIKLKKSFPPPISTERKANDKNLNGKNHLLRA